jgi:putative tryptophan/tyrosine transport system substrate-binding protein
MPVVGYLSPGLPEQAGFFEAFRKGLTEQGFVEGRNVAIESRYARNELDRLPELAADLVRRRASVIAATGGPAVALAAKGATATTPIVFEIGGDPVQDGLVASFNRPGGNITGITAMNAELDGKRLGLLAELVPGAGAYRRPHLHAGQHAGDRDTNSIHPDGRGGAWAANRNFSPDQWSRN